MTVVRMDAISVALRMEIQDFYYAEADYLDERDFRSWLSMLAPDIRYRVPMSRNVHSSATSGEFFVDDLAIHWMDEGIQTLTQRVEQFETGMHWAEEPVSRTSHLYTNIRILEVGEEEGKPTLTVKLRFLVYRNRLQGEADFMVGKRIDRLIYSDDGWQIRERSVFLDQTVLLAKNLTTFL